MNLFDKWSIFLDSLRPMFSESSKVAFSLFGIDIAWYAVIIMSGALISAIFGYYYYAKRLGVSSDNVFYGVALGLLFGILGARLYYVIFTASTGEVQYDSFLEVINPRDGGLAIHGGVIGAALFLVVFCKVRHIKLLYVLEIVMPLIMFSQSIGRWGNFVNQEAFGGLVQVEGLDISSLTHSSVLSDSILEAQRNALSNLLIPDFIIDRMYISYSSAGGFICSGYYYPTFLFESVLNFFGVTCYFIARKYIKKIVVGDALSFYLIWYGAVRIFIESMRTDPLMLGNTNIKVAQLISIIMIVGGILLIVFRRIYKYQLTPCKEALYGENASMMNEGYFVVEPFIGTVIMNTLKNKNQKLIIFDCDGTVLDTFGLIEKTVYKTFEKMLPDYKITKEEAHAFFGPLIDDSFRKYVSSEEEVDALVKCYREINESLMAEYIKAYDGIESTLKELKRSGFKIAIVSNKVTAAVVQGLEICNINQYFDLIVGAEQMTNAKPAPDGIRKALELLKKKDAILIGDTIIDIETGKNASIETIGVTWCKTTRKEFKENNATYIIDRPEEILKIVKE